MIDTLEFLENGLGKFKRLTPSEEEHGDFFWRVAPSGTQITLTCSPSRQLGSYYFNRELNIQIIPAGEEEETLVLSFWEEETKIESGSEVIEFPAQWCHHYFYRKKT